MAGEEAIHPDGAGAGSSPYMPRSPDPTAAVSAAVAAVTIQFQQSIAALRELLETRLAGMDEATRLLAVRMTELGATVDDRSHERQRNLQALMEQRLNGMDRASILLAEQVGKLSIETTATQGHVREEFVTADHGLREVLGARIDGMDQATKLLAQSFEKVPSDIDRGIGSLRQVLEGQIHLVQTQTLEKFAAVDALFASNATALTAALAAQEKAVAEQNKSNTLAIDKSEAATKETIAANANQTHTGLTGLSNVMDDLKSRVVRLEGLIQNRRTDSEDNLAVSTFSQTSEANKSSQIRAQVSAVIAGIAVLISIVTVVILLTKK